MRCETASCEREAVLAVAVHCASCGNSLSAGLCAPCRDRYCGAEPGRYGMNCPRCGDHAAAGTAQDGTIRMHVPGGREPEVTVAWLAKILRGV